MIHVKRVLLVLFCCAVSACGFTPLYAEKSAAPDEAAGSGLAQIYIDNIPDRDGQYLRNALIDRFYRNGKPQDPRYVLHVSDLDETLTDLDITKSSSATRGQLRLDAYVTLVDHRGGATVMKRKVLSITSYNILQSQFTTRVSEQAARQSALDDLAGQIERQVALFVKAEE
jgi:LPS-assembly lipoprotein